MTINTKRIAEICRSKMNSDQSDYTAGQMWLANKIKKETRLDEWQVIISFLQAGVTADFYEIGNWKLPASEVFDNLEKQEKIDFSILKKADLRKANLQHAFLRGVDLSGADLRKADLVNASLIGADLTGAVLRGADLGDADLTDANLTGANLSGASLDDTNLKGVKV